MYTSLQEYKELFTKFNNYCENSQYIYLHNISNQILIHGVKRVQINPDFYPDTIDSWCQKYWTIQNFYKDNLYKDFNKDFTVSIWI